MRNSRHVRMIVPVEDVHDFHGAFPRHGIWERGPRGDELVVYLPQESAQQSMDFFSQGLENYRAQRHRPPSVPIPYRTESVALETQQHPNYSQQPASPYPPSPYPSSPYPPPYNQPQHPFPQQGAPPLYRFPVSTGWKPWVGAGAGAGILALISYGAGYAIEVASLASGNIRTMSDLSFIVLLPSICCGLGLIGGGLAGMHIGKKSYEDDLRRAGYPIDKEREDRRREQLNFWFSPKSDLKSVYRSEQLQAQQPGGSAPKK